MGLAVHHQTGSNFDTVPHQTQTGSNFDTSVRRCGASCGASCGVSSASSDWF